ncbi:MAG TPA: DUF2470 domain-containing protein, partial [Minicystis sp.]|nr:DUF2470 domain-containing protein [Minicystis sp.]
SVAFDARGRPLLLISRLAEHTQNLVANADASVLVCEAVEAGREPLAAGRVTLIGRCARIDGEEARADARARFLTAHPDAAHYVDFKDFDWYRLEPIALRYVGGFGRMSWVTADAYAAAAPDPLVDAAAGILAHMNDDHGEALLAYAKALAGIADATAATMTAVDRLGFEMAVTTPAGRRAVRLAFDAPAESSDDVRRALVAMVKRARAGA